MTQVHATPPHIPPARANPASTWRTDLLAGISVFLIALPLCLGIATASSVAPFAGILAGVIGGLVVALLSGSRLSVSGPAAGLVVIVVQALATLGSFSAFLGALVLAGALQWVFGFLRAGRLASYVPAPVINGMLAAIGILLILNQLPLAAGLVNGGISAAIPLLALASLAILFAWEMPALRAFTLVRAIPAPLAVVSFGIAAVALVETFAPELALASAQRVAMPLLGSWDTLSQAFTFPDLTQWSNPDVWRVAMVIAIVASLETLLSLEALEQIDPSHQKAAPNRELKAQGVGNLLAGLLGALPVTAVVVRSAANVHAGARSRLSCMTHGVMLLIACLALTHVINLIPLASLAAILIHTGYKLAKPQMFVSMGRAGVAQAVPFIGTIAGVLATDLLIGIAIGFALSVVLVVERNFRRVLSFTQDGDFYLLSLRKSATFFCTPQLKHYLGQIPSGATLILDATHADHIDHDVHQVVDTYAARASAGGVRIEYKQWPTRR
ncbi:SulP family inorganic anion transporter [Paraburkholderia haematera]|uniref:C4-dicarboxylic acid transporter DauA n=1 Tax=Paraburkholderia haematera TaxID=2793077 RepID=A0ABM8SV05_9BURK|nr:SulP family inorganic anion transporter [Paraburkholderia haematera]CAE6835327.1 C4-dicarboxylic acid transporter DauA [Paraburkholderia haematera]